MPYDNTLYLMGYLGSDPEGGYFADGNAHAKISVACNDSGATAKGQEYDHVEWFAVLLRGKPAEFALNYLKKGNCVAVWGSIWSRHFTDKSGRARTVYEVRGNKVKFIAKSKGNEDDGGRNEADDGGAAAYFGLCASADRFQAA